MLKRIAERYWDVWPGYSKIEAKEDYDSERHRIEGVRRAEFAADRKVAPKRA